MDQGGAGRAGCEDAGLFTLTSGGKGATAVCLGSPQEGSPDQRTEEG